MNQTASKSEWSEKEAVRNLDAINTIRCVRGVSTFSAMPPYHRAAYECIAAHYPGVQVYACGSRVRGDYVDSFSDDSGFTLEQIRQARYKAGMKMVRESDFDYCLERPTRPIDIPPKWSDLVTCPVPESEMIPIPVFKFPTIQDNERVRFFPCTD